MKGGAGEPLLLAYYGDDFTGSTGVMESLARAGVPTALFLAPPTAADVARFPGLRAAGIAGMSRTWTPAEMKLSLPAVFTAGKALGALMFQYKVCSTFDSSPEVGSIGCALELGQEIFGSPFVPVVVGAPYLERYQLFGNLFASFRGEAHRIDRHPTMSHHPVTPMTEGDLRLHLGRQTRSRLALMDILQLTGPAAEVDRRLDALLAGKPDAVLFDVLDDARLEEVGRLLWQRARRAERSLFSVSSSGLDDGLVMHWRTAGVLPQAPPAFAAPGAVDRLLVVSGSCSPVSEAQIAWALAHGFVAVAADSLALLDPTRATGARDAAVREAADHLAAGRSVIVHSARGPGDPRIEAVQARGDAGTTGRALGQELGRIARALCERQKLRRLVIAGGDTSGHAAIQLGVTALQMIAPGAPGSPLCRATATTGPTGAALAGIDGLELMLKGGQMGRDNLYGLVLEGKGP